MSDIDNAKATKEEKAFFKALMWKLWEEWTDSLEKMTEEQRAEEQEFLDLFMAETGAKKNSPGYLMFSAFMGGINKGIELTTRLDKKENPASAATPAGTAN